MVPGFKYIYIYIERERERGREIKTERESSSMHTYIHMYKERTLKCVCMGFVGGGLCHMAPRLGPEYVYIWSGTVGPRFGRSYIFYIFLSVRYVVPVVPGFKYIYI